LLFPLSVISIPNKATWPYVQQWHLDVQHDVSHGTVVTLAYVASKGTSLGRKYELNQLHPVPASQNPYKRGEAINANGHDDCGTMMTPSGVAITGQAAINLQVVCGADPNPFRPFLGIGDITRLDNGASSSYNALQAELRRSQGRLQVNVSYTFSHSIDDASDGGVFGDGGILNTYNPHAFRASSNFDQRHQISVSTVYSLPPFNGTGWRNRLLGGWEVSGIGLWLTVSSRATPRPWAYGLICTCSLTPQMLTICLLYLVSCNLPKWKFHLRTPHHAICAVL
jgi:hypothetical protein